MEALGAQGWDLLARMLFGFLAAVAGITLWAHTREASWLLIVAATLVGYVEVLLRFVDALGVFSLDSVAWQGIPVIRVGFAIAVPLLYALGLVAGVRSFRKP
jgi:hypothetical protein